MCMEKALVAWAQQVGFPFPSVGLQRVQVAEPRPLGRGESRGGCGGVEEEVGQEGRPLERRAGAGMHMLGGEGDGGPAGKGEATSHRDANLRGRAHL